jgi:hypothetical protein
VALRLWRRIGRRVANLRSAKVIEGPQQTDLGGEASMEPGDEVHVTHGAELSKPCRARM